MDVNACNCGLFTYLVYHTTLSNNRLFTGMKDEDVFLPMKNIYPFSSLNMALHGADSFMHFHLFTKLIQNW